ncbi:MAG: T9SS type A sorting domain-containing protein [Bacteroidia bacterium]|nr:T9SS type A sorting domain-containing protein [Bacteroidia bacterium]
MKRNALLLTILLFFCELTKSQQILTENFAYTANQALTANGWSQIGPFGNSPVLVSSGGLNYTGYVLSAIGNAAIAASTGQDVYTDLYLGFSSGIVYSSFMLKVDTAKTGDYFLGFLPSGVTNPYTGKVYVKQLSNGYYTLGVSKAIEPAIYGTDSFAIGITSLVVLKYQFIAGNNNDSITLFNFTAGFPTTEPASGFALTTGGTSVDAPSIGRIAIRQGNTASSPSCIIDGIRVGTSWSDLNATTSNKPLGLQNFIVANIGNNNARITWNKPLTYNNTTQTIVIFIKKGSAITQGTPSINSGAYVQDANFAGLGSPYQNDSLAKCVYKGDTTDVIVTGLQANVAYFLLAYIIIDADSLYSFPSLANATTPTSAPNPATGFIFTATGASSANLSWTKGFGYNNGRHTQLVFMKAGSPITTGSNNADPGNIPGDANFLGYGANYQNDSLAKCIYNGDTTKVSVTGLTPGTLYYVIIFGISTSDSVYSNATAVNGRTNSNGPSAVTGITFSSGSTSTARISWSKPVSYDNATLTTLLFIKELTPINSGIPPTQSPANIIANTDFNGSSSAFEYDMSAKCAFKGDTNFVNVINLKPGTTYYLVNYVVSDSGSFYSNPAYTNGITRFPAIGSATGAIFTASSKTTAKINWIKPTGYLNAGYTTLVFVKPIDTINTGIPSRPLSFYTATANITTGTIYQNDNLAHCVFKQDTNFINISGLVSGTHYYAVIFIVRDADSTYSTETLLNGYPLGTAPLYTISQVNRVKQTTGVADSLNSRATLRGLVYGVNLRTTPQIQFFVKDQTGGIMVFNQPKDFGYKVLEGDSVEVQGIINQSRGWTYIGTLDTIIFLGSGKTIKQATQVITLNENTENDFVKISNLNLFTQLNIWPTGTNTTVLAHKTGSTDTVSIRVYASTSIAGSLAPRGEFNVYGMGIQISSSANAPFTFDGYQILLSKAENYAGPLDTLSPFQPVLPLNNAIIKLNGDPTNTLTVFFTRSKEIAGVAPPHYNFLLDYLSGTFNLPLLNLLLNNGSSDTIAEIPFGLIANSFPNIKNGDSLVAKWIIRASTGTYTHFALDSRNITFKRGIFNGLITVEPDQKIVLSPNPAFDAFTIQSPVEPMMVQLTDITGKVVQNYEISDSYPVAHLPKGMYFVRMKIGDNILVKKIIVGL